MHRHGYKGRKLGREKDQRRALIKGLASSLTVNEKITTTLPKAKELVPYYEKLITKAKKGDLHNRRLVIAKMATVDSAHKLVDEIAPKLSSRNSGHLRISKLENRRGDNAEMAEVSFVDDLKKPAKKAEVKEVKKESTTKEAPKKAEKAKAKTVKKESK
jgi:large subunit ribosomal protein L17